MTHVGLIILGGYLVAFCVFCLLIAFIAYMGEEE